MNLTPPNPTPASETAATPPLRVVVITCAVLETEIAHFARQCPNVIRVEVLEQGLHNEPDRLRRELQAAITRIETELADAEVIVLGYGLCSRGTEGVRTQRCQLVIARAHDCITHLLGSKERYAQYVKEHPGTYWYSPGWNRCHIPPGPERYEKLYKKYLEQFSEDDAKYLMETEQQWFKSYSQATYVDVGIGATEEDVAYTQHCAAWLHWNFDRQRGDPSLIQAMLTGPWDDQRFLLLQPGQLFRMVATERVVEIASAPVQPPTTKNPS